MTRPKSAFLRTITERGFLHQCTDFEALDEKFSTATPVTAYIGFDCTANSLHVGSLIPIMLLYHLQKSGHKPIVLLGGGTTKIGDPSGKDESRKLLSESDIAQNMQGIKSIFSKFLKFGDGPTDAIMIDNSDWLTQLNYIEFLRDYGRHFSVNRMLGFDSVKMRLERDQPLSFLEFNYMILQAYDFLELARKHNCMLQMGGSDQWGNIVNGVELGRRVNGLNLFGLTTPLLTTSSGAKMGKTANGAVWLNSGNLSPWDYWQFWRNSEDGDVPRFLKFFTSLPLDEIERLAKLQNEEINEAKKILATEATRLAHGNEAASEALETARQTFENGLAADNLPTIEITAKKLSEGIPVFALFVEAGLAGSNGEARRLIKGGGAKINDTAVSSENNIIRLSDSQDGSMKLTAGKKRHVLVKVLSLGEP